MKTRVGIMGYGNLGRGVEAAIAQNPDMELVGVFTRRDPAAVKIATAGVGVYKLDDCKTMQDDIDVMILCGGSAADLPWMSPEYAHFFNTVESFDTHADIPWHVDNVNASDIANDKTSIVSCGWDPGLFSVNRVMMDAVLPVGKAYTFWGRGVSQGHSDAVRQIPGVKDARQYTLPVQDVIDAIRGGAVPELTPRQMHTREVFVVCDDDVTEDDKADIVDDIKTMPAYFEDYDTTVHFISEEEMQRDHSGMPHGGFVIRSGGVGPDGKDKAVVEFSLNLDSNPEFTGSVLVACARACHRMNQEGSYGCKTMLDVPPAYYSPMSRDELLEKMM